MELNPSTLKNILEKSCKDNECLDRKNLLTQWKYWGGKNWKMVLRKLLRSYNKKELFAFRRTSPKKRQKFKLSTLFSLFISIVGFG